jgi:hypothetical protein
MPNPLLTLVERQRAEVGKNDAAILEQIARAYTVTYGRLQGDIDALVLAIGDEKLSAAALKQLPQYKRLIRNATAELDKFTEYTKTTIETAALGSIGAGLAHSAALITAMTGSKFAGVDGAAMRYLLNYLKNDGPLYKRLAELTGATVDRVVQQIVDGVGSGFNPRKIADLITDAFGGGLTDALRNTRTVQIWSYRDSARANYIATDGIVEGWIWYAHLGSGRVCMSCVSQHGSVHGLDEALDDHYNGECVPLPYIPQFGNPIEQSGQEWFEKQPEAEQRKMMGGEKYDAWKGGKFSFEKLSKHVENEVYGTMSVVTPLKELVGEK